MNAKLMFFLCISYCLWLFVEKWLLQKNRNRLSHVIHVNGIRGKSSVTRLIKAGLSSHYAAFAKTTGTKPVTISPQGVESEIVRFGSANILEQIKIMALAAKQKATVAVIECMALQPSYQEISTKTMLQANIGVITNIRHDHTDIFGENLEDIAQALAHSIPKKWLFVSIRTKIL